MRIYSEVKKAIEDQKTERKKSERMAAVKNVEAFKKKRQLKHKRKRENDRKKNLMEKLSKYT